MNRNTLGYVAIGLVALIISVISTNRLMQEERAKTRKQMLSVQARHEVDKPAPKIRRRLHSEAKQ